MTKILAQGAEATLKHVDNKVIKERIKKSYRHEDIDNKLRKQRTRKEAKLLKKLETLDFPAPKLISVDEKDMIIEMEFIKGKLVKDILDKQPELAEQIGELLGILHDNNIIHADLTTSNMILKENKIFFIDFGLSFHSLKEEDKAVDLHLLAQAMESKHYKIFPEVFEMALQGYKNSNSSGKVLKRLEIVNSRGRYKKKKN